MILYLAMVLTSYSSEPTPPVSITIDRTGKTGDLISWNSELVVELNVTTTLMIATNVPGAPAIPVTRQTVAEFDEPSLSDGVLLLPAPAAERLFADGFYVENVEVVAQIGNASTTTEYGAREVRFFQFGMGQVIPLSRAEWALATDPVIVRQTPAGEVLERS